MLIASAQQNLCKVSVVTVCVHCVSLTESLVYKSTVLVYMSECACVCTCVCCVCAHVYVVCVCMCVVCVCALHVMCVCSVCVMYVYAVIKYITRSDLREEKFILAHGLLWKKRQEARVAQHCGPQGDCEAACSGLGENAGSRLGYSLQVPTPTSLESLFPQLPKQNQPRTKWSSP